MASSSSQAQERSHAALSASSPLDPDGRHSQTLPATSNSASVNVPLLPDDGGQPKIPRSRATSASFVSSPLNPNALAGSSPPLSIGSRGQSRQTMTFNRVASEESQVLASTSQRTSLPSNRASMILYRLAGEDEQRSLSPPILSPNRQSFFSNSGDSTFTVSYDSKYPSGVHTPQKLIPYPFDPNLHVDTPEDDDALHDPSDDTPFNRSSGFPVRGFVNVGVLVLVILALLCLFIFYPVWHYYIQDHNTDR